MVTIENTLDSIADVEQPKEIKRRRIVDFKTMDRSEKNLPAIFCLTDDGKMYGLVFTGNELKWEELPAIPQD